MRILFDPFDSKEWESVNRGCIPFLNRFHLIFETQEEGEAVKKLLEHSLEEEENESSL